MAVLDGNCDTKGSKKPLGAGPDPKQPGGLVFTVPAHYLDRCGSDDYHSASYIQVTDGVIPSFEWGYRIYRGRNQVQFPTVGELKMASFSYTSRGNVDVSSRPSYQHSTCETEQYVILLGSSV